MSLKSTPALPVVAAVGGLDPSAGAGVVADARTVSELGAVPVVVATAITVQSGLGVRSSTSLDPGLVVRQISVLTERFAVSAWKIGQVPDASIATALAAALDEARSGEGTPSRGARVSLVIDPVFAATGGGTLASEEATEAVVSELFPRATLVTVNLDEAARFAGFEVTDEAGMERAGKVILNSGAGAVLVKGGHLDGEPVDVLVDRDGPSRFVGTSRVLGPGMHGTGCALASAVATGLASGSSLSRAIEAARLYVHAMLVRAVRIDEGPNLRPPSLS